jgi:phosphoribosylformylglycinamidine synthase
LNGPIEPATTSPLHHSTAPATLFQEIRRQEKTGADPPLHPTSHRSIGMKATIIVTPKKAVLDPQGKTVANALEQMGYKGIGAVHVGKYLEIELPAGDPESWRKQLDQACHRILSNPVIEDYHLEIEA